MLLRLLSNNLFVLFLAVLILFAGCGEKKTKSESQPQPTGRTLQYEQDLAFIDATSSDTLAVIEVAVADDNEERNTGLMDVNELPSDKGMLFIFPNEQMRSFWMANTPLSLDIIFVNAEYQIVRIHQSTKPFTNKSLPSEKPSKYVVEVNGGFCLSHDIQEGDRILLAK